MFIVAYMEKGVLRDSTFAMTEKQAEFIAAKWHRKHYADSKKASYIAVEEARLEGGISKRHYQFPLEAKPMKSFVKSSPRLRIDIFVIALIKDGDLQCVTYATAIERADEIASAWLKKHQDSKDETGYIAVDKVTLEGMSSKRLVQMELGNEPGGTNLRWEL